eukprot:TRINITY_DN19388_c0_g1_i1.p1 TRINITY_DN19388_c0_g1~~TRINITY_DN19388_c0_g1_i1.p1  ORF type:complete len:442 (+),score=94.69 TRINITY_DN19388_c0_g1_i1:119-1327(+)
MHGQLLGKKTKCFRGKSQMNENRIGKPKRKKNPVVISQKLLEIFEKGDSFIAPQDPVKVNKNPTNHPKKSPSKLYIDILNFKQRFFRCHVSDWEADYKNARQKVRVFVSAAKNSNYDISIFLDQTVSTREAARKWKMRRTRDLEKKSVKMLPGTKLIGDFFRRHQIPVHYSTVDNDDTIASFAAKDGAAVLSADCDFFRYRTSDNKTKPYKLFSNFYIQRGKLVLEPHEGAKKVDTSYREILDPPPDTNFNPFKGALNALDDARLLLFEIQETEASKCYIRGLSTCLTKEFENLQRTVKPLRQAVYSRLKLGLVHEVYPTWRNRVVWVSEDTAEDPALDRLLDNPLAAVREMFEHQKKPGGPETKKKNLLWKNHLFGQKLVVAELCAWARGLDVADVLDQFL